MVPTAWARRRVAAADSVLSPPRPYRPILFGSEVARAKESVGVRRGGVPSTGARFAAVAGLSETPWPVGTLPQERSHKYLVAQGVVSTEGSVPPPATLARCLLGCPPGALRLRVRKLLRTLRDHPVDVGFGEEAQELALPVDVPEGLFQRFKDLGDVLRADVWSDCAEP